MIRTPPSPAVWWGWCALATLALALAPLAFNDNTLTLLLIYALLSLSLGLIWGQGGILCFGQAAFFGVGAYAYAISAINIGESTGAMLLAVLVAGGLAAILGAFMFYGRISDVYLGVITLVTTLLLFKFMNSTAGSAYAIGKAPLGGFNGIPGFPILNIPFLPEHPITGLGLYAVCAVILLLTLMGCRGLVRSRFGRALAGLRENDLRAQLLGYDTRWLRTVLFTIGGALAGLAGGLYACWAEIVTPGLFSLGQSAEIIIWVLVGGVGTFWGPVLGAIVLSSVKVALASQQMIDNNIVLGIILLVGVLVFPSGLISLLERWFLHNKQGVVPLREETPEKRRQRRLREGGARYGT